MSHKINAEISKSLPKETDLAVKMIVSMTGERAEKFLHMSEDEIFQYLAYLMKCKKEKLFELFRSHDQNHEVDIIELANLWKLNAKNILKAKRSPLGRTPIAFFEKILTLMGQRADAVRMMVENGGSAISSQTMTSVNPNISFKNSTQLARFVIDNLRVSNDNAHSGKFLK